MLNGFFGSHYKLIIPILENYARHDLLNLKLAYRLGKELELKDPFTGQSYRFDEKNLAYLCAGRDQKYFTEDDIKLPLNGVPKL